MSKPAKIVVFLIGLLHLYLCVFEMFMWEARGPVVFPDLAKLSPDFFQITKTMAANQGLYNAILGVALILAALIKDGLWQRRISLYLLSGVFVAGVYGAYTVDLKILFAQAVPAVIGIALILFVKSRSTTPPL